MDLGVPPVSPQCFAKLLSHEAYSTSLGEDRRDHRHAVYDLAEHLLIGSIIWTADRLKLAPDKGAPNQRGEIAPIIDDRLFRAAMGR
jgi:hypothetical protein